jgi:hypothetical protein
VQSSPQYAAPTTPAAAPPSSAAAAASAPGTLLLPPGLQLPAASSPAAIEHQLTSFMSRGLRPLLPPAQYSSLMGHLKGCLRGMWGVEGSAGSSCRRCTCMCRQQLMVGRCTGWSAHYTTDWPGSTVRGECQRQVAWVLHCGSALA